jgi:oligogalacturonide lyase
MIVEITMTTHPPQIFPAESHIFTDPHTGAVVRQVTDHTSIHHHPFYYLPAYDNAMTRLFFVSHRTGQPEIWCELRSTGELQQITHHAGLAEWSVHPSHNGQYVYFTDAGGGWRVDVHSGEEENVLHFDLGSGHEMGMVGAAMGTTTLSHDDAYWAVPVKVGSQHRFYIVDTRTGSHEVILESDTIGHPEFHPSDNTLLRYAGPYHSRIWVLNRDGSANRLAYERQDRQWIVHETWRPGSREIITTTWPHGCLGIDIDTHRLRTVCSFNAWHPSINRQGTLMCSDTTYPDRGLQLFNPLDGIGAQRTLCFPHATNEGIHWNTDHCPYDDEDYKLGKWKVYAPQHTHPHPSFSPDGRFVAFTSDCTGHSQVYEVEISNNLTQNERKSNE